MVAISRLDSVLSSESAEKNGDSSQNSKNKRKQRSNKCFDKREEKVTKHHRKSKRQLEPLNVNKCLKKLQKRI